MAGKGSSDFSFPKPVSSPLEPAAVNQLSALLDVKLKVQSEDLNRSFTNQLEPVKTQLAALTQGQAEDRERLSDLEGEIKVLRDEVTELKEKSPSADLFKAAEEKRLRTGEIQGLFLSGGPISFDRDLKKFLRDCARYPQISNMRLEEAEAFSTAMMSTIKSKSSWKPGPNPKKPNKKLGQPKTTLVFDLDDNAEKCDKLFGEWFCIETKDRRLFFCRILKNEQQKKQSRVRWARGVLASPDAHDEEEVKEAKKVVAKEGDEDGSRPAVNPALHTADTLPGLQGASMVFYSRSHGPPVGAIARPTPMTAPMVAPMYSFASSFPSPYPYHQGYSDGMLNGPQPLPAPHFFSNSQPVLSLNGGMGSEQAGMVPVGGGEERQETAVESGPLFSSFADIDRSHQTPPASPARRGQI
uniref:Uncharacterized protein n=1 Tax=Chromera velia CCMP2878 TaxID=1169474 RepID=A0A0G4HEX8_9ALVE|eukprot:Cvel_26917.t1-p1 / transcript=Cvel_26917.t1 / gene=Cvel_26917 / organism=Chromera_velia_CCMP2878 / gene_product=hypothetical protein / transcript_product=hypothetical protein / location=Cvel_scaffold3274:15628-16860(-) / protein_length=411 / sequence_SO=supercontig / SO=protein_coding / is_pseudo=false